MAWHSNAQRVTSLPACETVSSQWTLAEEQLASLTHRLPPPPHTAWSVTGVAATHLLVATVAAVLSTLGPPLRLPRSCESESAKYPEGMRLVERCQPRPTADVRRTGISLARDSAMALLLEVGAHSTGSHNSQTVTMEACSMEHGCV